MALDTLNIADVCSESFNHRLPHRYACPSPRRRAALRRGVHAENEFCTVPTGVVFTSSATRLLTKVSFGGHVS